MYYPNINTLNGQLFEHGTTFASALPRPKVDPSYDRDFNVTLTKKMGGKRDIASECHVEEAKLECGISLCV